VRFGAMGDDVFTRIPEGKLRELAEHGVNGAKKELDRRKYSLQPTNVQSVILKLSLSNKNLIEGDIQTEESFTQVSPLETQGMTSKELTLPEKSNTILDDSYKITPTNEQKNILNAKGRVVKINARAGTGKTATLLMIAQRNLDKKIIYLVFNNRNRQEAKSKFPDNVNIHTIHSFARSASGSSFDGHKAVRPSFYFKYFSKNKETLATLTADFIVYFINSTYLKPDDAIDSFSNKLSDELRVVFTQSQSDIIETSRSSLNSWYKNKKDCPHDFYLRCPIWEKIFRVSWLNMILY